MTSRRLGSALVLVLSIGSASSAGAQAPPSRAPSGRPIVSCAGQPINDIVIYADAPTVASLARVPRLASIARAFHATTRPELIRRFLLLERGDACSEQRRADSERILRAQPYIAEADAFVVANESGGVDLEVATSDEAAIVFGGNVRAASPHLTSVLGGSANVAGQGLYAAVSWRDGASFRDAIGIRIIDHQFLGRPWTFSVEGERASLGGSWRSEAAHPFLTDLQRVGWRVRLGQANGFVELRQPDGIRPRVALQRGFFDVGGILRVGNVGPPHLVGFSLTGLQERPGDRLTLPESGMVRDIGPVPAPFARHRILRANALIGVRKITFARLEGVDALTAVQDVPIGLQLGMLFGRSLPKPGEREEEDVFLAGDLYVGATSGRMTSRLQLQAEGRRPIGSRSWDGVIATGRVTNYTRISSRHRNQLALEFSGAYRQRTPFQLLLGVPEGGVRGYEESYYAGGQRLVARTEERYVLGNIRGAADAGVAVFGDVGRQWAGDVPYGVTTSVKASLGISLLASIPPRSARVWRADLAFPVTGGANARWTLSFTNADRTAFVFRNARDVAVGKEVTVPTSIFAWP
ncbi:MAG: hypothetical protein LH467_04225 [Gemmatimonadaceae bacterium]|nr:hypothetical protein [Gemmatimonadaceae bacterium]